MAVLRRQQLSADRNVDATPPVLLNRLKLARADLATQSAGIAEWLRDHTPTAGLVRILHRRGFGDLLDEGNDPQP